MNWHVGQDVVCIETHPKGIVKEGEPHIISGIRKSPCHHIGTLIDVGLTFNESYALGCAKCNIVIEKRGGVRWLDCKLFAPLDELTSEFTELTEILENTKPFEVK